MERGKDASSSAAAAPLEPEHKAGEHGGWRGWVVVAASACSLFLYMGVIYSWGILQAGIAHDAAISLTSLTFVGSLATSFMCSICILVGKSIRRFGYPATAMAGAVLLGLGEFLSGFVSGNLAALFVTHGVLFGVGGGLTILVRELLPLPSSRASSGQDADCRFAGKPCSTAPLKWFRRHRGLATGVVFGGGSLGAAVMGVATHELVRRVGVPWTFRILGFLLWAVCLPAACCIRQPPSSGPSIPELQWHRWRDADFVIILIGTAVGCFPLFVPPYFIPMFARALGGSSSVGIIALSVWNMASTAGRVFAGYTADSLIGPINSLIVSMLLCGLSTLAIWPFASSMAVLLLFAVVNGIGCGSFFSLFPTCLGAVFGAQNTMAVLPIMWSSWFFGFFLVRARAAHTDPADACS